MYQQIVQKKIHFELHAIYTTNNLTLNQLNLIMFADKCFEKMYVKQVLSFIHMRQSNNNN